MTDAEHERLTGLAESEGLTLGEWCRQVLLERANSWTPKTVEQTVLAEVLALRTILLNVFYQIAQGVPLTADEMQSLIERADQDKLRKAEERLATVARGAA
jgi:hypothetical protein